MTKHLKNSKNPNNSKNRKNLKNRKNQTKLLRALLVELDQEIQRWNAELEQEILRKEELRKKEEEEWRQKEEELRKKREEEWRQKEEELRKKEEEEWRQWREERKKEWQNREEILKIKKQLIEDDKEFREHMRRLGRDPLELPDVDKSEFDLYYGRVDGNGEWEPIPPELYKIK